MPLARIFTRYPERAASLSEQLEQQGYRVEVSSPDQAHLPPADLEIEFEICDRADVLERAAQLAEEFQADVAVAPGVLQAEAQAAAELLPTADAAAGRQAEIDAQAVAEVLPMEAAAQAPTEVVPAELAVSMQKTPMQGQRDREREFEEAFQPAAAPVMHESEREIAAAEEPAPAAAANQAIENAMPPVAMLEEEPSGMRAEPVMSSIEEPVMEQAVRHETVRDAVRPADPVPYLAQLTPFGKPAEHDQIKAAEYRIPQEQPQLASRTDGDEPVREGVGRNVATIFSAAMTGLKSASASAAESFRERVQEYKKRTQVRRAEAHAARVARMLDLEQRKAEAQQRAAELEAAREAASARLLELVRERQPGLSEEDRKAAPVAEPAPYRKRVESLRHASIARMQTKLRKPMSPQLRAVLTGAAAVTLIFVIGIVLGEFYPRTPLASPADHSANGVTVQTGAPAAQNGGVTLKTGDSAQPQTPAQAQPSVTQAAAPAKPSPRVTQARHLVSTEQEEAMGDDVVIRHFSRPATTQKPRQTPQQAGLKHFSDLDN
jgi:hypothetical protein